jgi:hypothetical protein
VVLARRRPSATPQVQQRDFATKASLKATLLAHMYEDSSRPAGIDDAQARDARVETGGTSRLR